MFTLKITTTKPAGTAWRTPGTIAGANVSNITARQWTLSQPGVLSSVVNSREKGALTRIAYIEFTDEAAADAFIAARDAVPEFQARAAYRAAHNMTQTVTKLQVV